MNGPTSVSVACIAALGCAASTNSNTGAPSWYLGPPPQYPPTEFIVGVGACAAEVPISARPACASQRAVEQVALQLVADVKASREHHEHTGTRRVGGLVETSRQSSVDAEGESRTALQLEDTAPARRTCVEETCYALVAISRHTLIARARQRGEVARFDAMEHLALARSSRLATALVELERAESAATRFVATTRIARALGGGDDARALTAAVARERAARFEAVTACFSTTSADLPAEAVFDAVRARVVHLGVTRTHLGPDCGGAEIVLALDARARVHESAEKPVWVAEIGGTIRVSFADGSTSSGAAIDVRAVESDRPRALAAAKQSLAADIVGALDRALAIQTTPASGRAP